MRFPKSIFILIIFLVSIIPGVAISQTSENVNLIGQWAHGPCYAVSAKDSYAFIGNGASFQVLNVADPSTPQLLGEVNLSELILKIVIEGNYAYVAVGNSGLRIIDISNISNPTVVASFVPTTYTEDVAVDLDYAYVAAGDSGLIILNITDPSNPVQVGYYDVPDQARCVSLGNGYAYVSNGWSVRIINISNPTSPSEAGVINLMIRDVEINENYAYMVTGFFPDLRIFDIANPADPIEVGSIATPGEASGLSVCGNFVYVADEQFGLRIINVSNPASPSEAGYYDTPGEALAVTFYGAYAFVADRESGLRIVKPINPSVEGSYDTPDTSRDIAISEMYAYVADYTAGLRIINISNPSSPNEVGYIITRDRAEGVAFREGYAYIADGDSGLYIADVSNPNSPTEAGFLSTPGWSYDVSVHGSYAYIADGHSGLRIIDISNPYSPSEVGDYDTPSMAVGLAIEGNYAYVADDLYGLRIIDVSNPANPFEAGYYHPPGFEPSNVAVRGEYAYVTHLTGFSIINISNPANPYREGFYDAIYEPMDVTLDGMYAYVCGDGFHVINILDPSNPITAGEFELSNWILGIKVHDNHAFLASGYSGISIMKILDANEEGYYNTADEAMEVAVSGNYAYVADDDAGLRIINISNPADPSETSYLTMPDKTIDIKIDDTYAYVAAASSGLRVIDISNPNSPNEIGSYDTPGYSYGIAISGDYAYIADMGSGLRIINISNPFAPIEEGFFLTTHGAHGVFVDENYAYVADSDGMYIINISNPSSPSETGYYNTPSYAYDVVINGNYAYVADGHGLCVVNVSNPSNPIEEAYLVTPGSATDVVLNGNYVCIADGYSGGLRLIDVSDPVNPREEGYYDTSSDAKGVTLSEGYIYIADYEDGLYILQETIAPFQAENLTASGSSPSPWQNSPSFELNWDNPGDLSGINLAKYKFDSVPTSNDDFSGMLSDAPLIVSALREGDQILYLWLVDGAGNEDFNNYSSVILRYDNSISLPTNFSESHEAQDNTWHNITNNPTFNWTSPSDLSGIAKYFIYFGSNPNGAMATDSTINTSFTTTTPQGTSYLRVQTKDNAGNISEWLTGFIFRFDNTPPTAPTFANEQNNTVSDIWQKDIATPTFSWSGAGDNISDIANYWVYFGNLINGDPQIEVTSEAYNAPLSMDGIYYLRIQSEDLAGNQSAPATLFIFKHDDQAPINPSAETFADITGQSQNNVWQNDSNDPNFVWGAGSDTLSGVHGYYYYWGREPNGTSLSLENFRTTRNFNPAPVDTGSHYFRVVTKDSVEKLAQSWMTGYIFKYDNIPPQGTIAESPPTSPHETFVVKWLAGSDDGGSGIKGWYDVRYKEGAGNWIDWLSDYESQSAEFDGEHGQTYYFEAIAIDSAGNKEVFTSVAEDTTVVDTFAIDNEAPGKPLNLTANNGNPSPWRNNAEFDINWTDPDDMTGIDSAYYKLDSAPSSNTDTTGSALAIQPIKVTITREGGQDLFLWLMDRRGNVDYLNHAMVRLRFDQTKPQGTIASSRDTTFSDTFTVTWSGGTDSGGSGISGYEVRVKDNTGDWETWLNDTSSTSGVYTGESGHSYFFEAAAIDSAGNVEDFEQVAECSTYVQYRLTINIAQLIDEQSDSVLIEYNINNFTGNPTNLLCEYSLDTGSTWYIATVEGDTNNITTQNYQGSIIWNSNNDTTGIDLETVKFRITPYDKDGLGIPFITESFHLDNNDIPSISIEPLQGKQKDDIQISYQLFDTENDTLSIVCEYYNQNIQDWNLATIQGDTSSLTAYDSLIVVWKSSVDLPGVVGNYKLKITPVDNDRGSSDSISILIDQIGAPVVESLSNFTEEQSDSVKIDYLLHDEQGDAIDLDCHYSANSGNTWNLATVLGTTIDITSGNYAGSLIWLSMTDLPGIDKNTVRFRITPDMNESLAKETDDFHLDNNKPPLIQNIGIIDSPTSGLVEIPFGITDIEDDTIHFSGKYRLTGESWIQMNYIDTVQVTPNNYIDTLKWNSINQLGFGEFKSLQIMLFPLDNDLGDSVLSNIFDVSNYAGDYTGDIRINRDDFLIFAQAWYNQDIVKEIGPAAGQPPLLIPDPDGRIDFEDLMVLVQQWNWSYDHPTINKVMAKTHISPNEIIPWTRDQMTTLRKSNQNIEYIWKNDSLREEDNLPALSTNEHLVSIEQSDFDQWLNEFGNEITFKLDTISPILGSFMELSYNPDDLEISDIENILLQEYNGFTFRVKDDKKGKMFLNTVVLEEKIESDSWEDGLFLLRLAFKKDGEVPLQINWQVFNIERNLISAGRQNYTLSGHVAVPKRFALYQNFPNPFNPSTTIRYQLPVSGKVKLEIFNILGQKVKMLVDEKQEAGYYSHIWNASQISHQKASGLYIARLCAQGEDGSRYSRSIKVLLIK